MQSLLLAVAWVSLGAPPDPSLGRGHEPVAPTKAAEVRPGVVGKTPRVGKVSEPEVGRMLPPAERRMRLVVKDANIHDVLRMAADVGEVNLFVADEVKGRVTLKLEDVVWSEAFHAILRSKQLGFERQGDIIVVDTLPRMVHRAEQRARTLLASKEAAPLVTTLVPVRFASAEALLPVVRSLLSARGTVAVDKRTNTLIVTDVAAEQIRARLVL